MHQDRVHARARAERQGQLPLTWQLAAICFRMVEPDRRSHGVLAPSMSKLGRCSFGVPRSTSGLRAIGAGR